MEEDEHRIKKPEKPEKIIYDETASDAQSQISLGSLGEISNYKQDSAVDNLSLGSLENKSLFN